VHCHYLKIAHHLLQWKTVAGRSKSYTDKVKEILGANAHLSTPIMSVKKTANGRIQYELFTANNVSVGVFDELIFACHPPTAWKILNDETVVDPEALDLLKQIEYADNVIYVHSDPKLMPLRRRAWASWNCMGKSKCMSVIGPTKRSEAFEGGESGFGNTKKVLLDLEGEEGRMKAVYVTYWLNRLQNLKTDEEVFVSLNPHQPPAQDLIQKRIILAHPQFNPNTLRAREALDEKFQGKDGIWFCGAWEGYGFHEDGCRSGFTVATKLSGVPLPWAKSDAMVIAPPDLSKVKASKNMVSAAFHHLYQSLTRDIPVAVCRRFIFYFLEKAVKKGTLQLKFNDGSMVKFGDGSFCGCDASPVTLRVFDSWFFVKTALEYDLGLARSYMAGHYVVEPLKRAEDYDPVVRPLDSADESNIVLGDPVGLMRLFMLFIGNRDRPELFQPRKAGRGSRYSNAMTNGSGLLISKLGSIFNYLRYKLTMDNSERGGSLKNIHAHYDLSNDLFTSFLDPETLMYSSAIYDAVRAPPPQTGLVFRGTLEEAQWRKLDTLLARAQLEPSQSLLDIGFGWGGLSLHAAKKYGCKVVGITLSVEQKALAEKRVEKEGLRRLISFEVCDYRTFARRKENRGRFDRVVSCEMIEAVGHDHLGEFFWAVEQVLAPNGILVMEAITTPEMRYETYLRSTDFINTIIFPGSCCPSLHALVDAAYHNSSLTLEHVSNVGLHYARTLAEWRRRFNANEALVRQLGFDDVFLRVWNYYMTYCEAGFHSQTENCLILCFSRQGCQALVPLCETRAVVQAEALTTVQVASWLDDK
jgi:cyclopropane-fatty-acyl-phospholipid synthase